jgi:hypothetical protein
MAHMFLVRNVVICVEGLFYSHYSRKITKYVSCYVFITQNFVFFHVFEQFQLQVTFRRLNVVIKERD